MSNRERWIVYPLLFLALFSSVGDKLVPEDTARYAAVECGRLTLVTPDRKPVMSLRPDDAGAGEIVVYQSEAEPVLRLGMDEHGHGAVVEGWSAQHENQFRLQAHTKGSYGEWSRSSADRILIGFSPFVAQSGLWGLDLQDQPKIVNPLSSASPNGSAPVSVTPGQPLPWGLPWPVSLATGAEGSEHPDADDK